MIFIISYFFLTIWLVAVALSQSVAQVLVFRFLAGFFGSSPLSNAGGVISDVLDANQRGLGMALFAAAPFVCFVPVTCLICADKISWDQLLDPSQAVSLVRHTAGVPCPGSSSRSLASFSSSSLLPYPRPTLRLSCDAGQLPCRKLQGTYTASVPTLRSPLK
jgi:MFS family permease